MITNARPAELGRVGAAIGVTPHATQPQRSAAQGAALRRKPRPGQRLKFAKVHSSIYDSSLMEESDSVRLFFLLLLPKADWEGFVAGTEESLSRLFNMSLDSVREAIRIHSGPDPRSRTPDNEGRRIEKVQGGWRILNFELYREGDAFSGTDTKTGIETEKKKQNIDYNGDRDRDRDRDKDIDRAGDAIGQVNGPIRQVIGVSSEELKAYNSLGSVRIKSLFLILREWASIAAAKGEGDFGVSQIHLEERLRCRRQSVGEMLEKLVGLGVIKLTQTYKPKVSPARYRWVINTTVPIPPMPSPNPDDEIPF